MLSKLEERKGKDWEVWRMSQVYNLWVNIKWSDVCVIGTSNMVFYTQFPEA